MKFKYAKITNSRLMGSMGLRISWESEGKSFDQYFLLDCEGLGLSDYMSIVAGSERELAAQEERLMGGLGSDRIFISEAEAVFLVKEYAGKSLRYGRKLPGKASEYGFESMSGMSGTEYEKLFFRLCKDIESDIEFVNYMTMRFIARDREALGFYSVNSHVAGMHITDSNGTLLKNSVRRLKRGSYLCRCIYEDMHRYFRASIGFSIEQFEKGCRLRSVQIGSILEIDCIEALGEIRKDEYIGIYTVNDLDCFRKIFANEMSCCLKSPFEKGLMLTMFKPDNRHVAMNEYFIGNDIDSIFFISNSGQLVVSNYSIESRIEADSMLLDEYSDYVALNDEFIFSGSLMYDFAQDESDNFYEFLSKR